jgi:hypothetical protein
MLVVADCGGDTGSGGDGQDEEEEGEGGGGRTMRCTCPTQQLEEHVETVVRHRVCSRAGQKHGEIVREFE